jgi:hypothetical protein
LQRAPQPLVFLQQQTCCSLLVSTSSLFSVEIQLLLG